jgi:hypothetical protein
MMKAAAAEMEALGIGLTERATSCTSLPDTTGSLSEAFALLHLAGRKLPALPGDSTLPSLRSYERRNSASGMRTLRRVNK